MMLLAKHMSRYSKVDFMICSQPCGVQDNTYSDYQVDMNKTFAWL